MKLVRLQFSLVIVAASLTIGCGTGGTGSENGPSGGAATKGTGSPSGSAAAQGNSGATGAGTSVGSQPPSTGQAGGSSGGGSAGTGGAAGSGAGSGSSGGAGSNTGSDASSSVPTSSDASPPDAQLEGGTTGSAGGGTLPPVTSVFDAGPFQVTIDMNVGPNSGWVAHPTMLGQNGLLHPIFTWGCGGGSQPSQYQDHLNFIASHGFVVEAHVSTGDGTDSKAAVDWLISENSNPSSQYYQKLDTTKIAAGGHSEGSITTYAFEANDTRLTTTIHVAGGSFDGNGYMDLHTPVCFIDGDQDTLALSNTQTDYMRATVPAFLTVMTGVDHIYAAREGLPVIVGWLRWQLGGETQRKSMFVGPNCDFCNGMYTTGAPESGGAFMSQSKNF